MDASKLCIYLDRKFKKTLNPKQYAVVMGKVDKIIGIMYGAITGLLVGATTQPLGPQSAARAFDEKMPYTLVSEKNALTDPVLGQMIILLSEFKNSKWDAEKFKTFRNYLTVAINSSSIKVDLQPQFVEQIRTNKPTNLYNLYSEDFYTRVPLCAMFGDASLTTAINKIMQTHTSFDASAYGIIATSVIQMILQKDDIFEDEKFNWDSVIEERFLPVITQYYTQYCDTYFAQDTSKLSEAEQKRIEPMKHRVIESYNDITHRIKLITSLYNGDRVVDENIDHLTVDQQEEYRITSIYNAQLDKLNLHEKHASHPALVACWVVRTVQEIHKQNDINSTDPSYLIKILLRSIAVRTGCSAYNCMIAGAVLGGIFGFTQIPEEFYSAMDPKLMDRISMEIWNIIANM